MMSQSTNPQESLSEFIVADMPVFQILKLLEELPTFRADYYEISEILPDEHGYGIWYFHENINEKKPTIEELLDLPVY